MDNSILKNIKGTFDSLPNEQIIKNNSLLNLNMIKYKSESE